jgi:hypothetical protein
MKKAMVLFLALLLAACNVSEDCFKKSGNMQEKDFALSGFSKIYVYPNISLVLTQGDDYAVHLSAGRNVIDDISADVTNGTLSLRDNSGCNLSRQYGGKTFYVTVPQMPEFEVFSNTAERITSTNMLTSGIIRLYAMDYFGGVGTGDFDVRVNNSQLVLQSNNISIFTLNGHADELLLSFYNDLSRFEGDGFPAGHIAIFQRSANDMIVRPTDSLTGNIYSTGNVICKTHPPVVNVTQHYTGHIIYQD